MTKLLRKLGVGLLIALSLAFVTQTLLMPDALWAQIPMMWLCYGVNFVLAILIFVFLFHSNYLIPVQKYKLNLIYFFHYCHPRVLPQLQ